MWSYLFVKNTTKIKISASQCISKVNCMHYDHKKNFGLFKVQLGYWKFYFGQKIINADCSYLKTVLEKVFIDYWILWPPLCILWRFERKEIGLIAYCAWFLPFTNITLIELCLWSCYLNCNCDLHITLQGVATWLVTVTHVVLQGVAMWLVTVTCVLRYRE